MTRSSVAWLRLIVLTITTCTPTCGAFSVPAVSVSSGCSQTFRTLHLFSTASSTSTNQPFMEVDGLYNPQQFARYEKLDKTFQALANQLPYLLLKPIPPAEQNEIDNIYTSDVILLAPNEQILASSLEELITLSTTLVAATTAAKQANALLLFNNNNNYGNNLDRVEHSTATDGRLFCQFIVDPTFLLTFITVQWQTQLVVGGNTLKGQSKIYFNESGQISKHQIITMELDGQPVNAIGEAVATIRRAVAQTNVWIPKNLPWKELRDLVQVTTASAQIATNDLTPPAWMLLRTATTNNNTLPVPGASIWNKYATAHKALTNFVNIGIPTLSHGASTTLLFTDDAQLLTNSNTVLCQGGTQVAHVYRTLASLKMGTDWNIQHVMVKDWQRRSVVVTWNASLLRTSVQGKDCFYLNEHGLVMRVEQMELTVAGMTDAEPWFRTLVSAIVERRNTPGTDLALDILEQMNPTAIKIRPDLIPTKEPPLNDIAAASVYNMLVTLHSDLAHIANLTVPPANEFLSPTVELRGYLNEVLARGDTQYRQAMGITLASFRGAIRSGRLGMEDPPKVTIEFQSDTSIRVTLLLQLKVKVMELDVFGSLPLTLELVALYKTNQNGKIQQHQWLETRVNGQLTPGDVVTQWLTKGPPDNFLLEALQWARTTLPK